MFIAISKKSLSCCHLRSIYKNVLKEIEFTEGQLFILRFDEEDFANGYSRNLLWRLWHASKALEMQHLFEACTKTLYNTLSEDTVFWDLNYAMQFREIGEGETWDTNSWFHQRSHEW